VQKVPELPEDFEIENAVDRWNWIYADRYDEGGVFDIQISQKERLADGTLDVSHRAFSTWIDIISSPRVLTS
jgi:hypothetical protein